MHLSQITIFIKENAVNISYNLLFLLKRMFLHGVSISEVQIEIFLFHGLHL